MMRSFLFFPLVFLGIAIFLGSVPAPVYAASASFNGYHAKGTMSIQSSASSVLRGQSVTLTFSAHFENVAPLHTSVPPCPSEAGFSYWDPATSGYPNPFAWGTTTTPIKFSYTGGTCNYSKSITVTPSQSGNWSLYYADAIGSTGCSVCISASLYSTSVSTYIEVTDSPPAPTVSLSANPSSITSGNSSTISWSSNNTTSCTGTNFSTGGAISGSRSVSPGSTTTYGVTCTGPGGQQSASAQVSVTSQSDVCPVTPGIQTNTSQCTCQDYGNCPPVCSPFQGQGCVSAPNSCNQTSAGTIQCNGSCSAVTPPNTNCPVSAPDLTAGNTMASANPTNAGTQITFTSSVRNIGSQASGGFNTLYQIVDFNHNHAINGINNVQGTAFSSMAAGGSGTVTATYTFPNYSSFPSPKTTPLDPNNYPYTFAMRLCADFDINWNQAVTNEANEGNNCGNWYYIQVNPGPPQVDLKINGSDGPIAVTLGSNLNITWGNVANAVSCIGTGSSWAGNKAVSGGNDTIPASSSVYTLTCTNSGGVSVSDSVAVTLSNVLKVCENSCSSGLLRGTPGSPGSFSMATGSTRNLVACFNTASGCSNSSGNVSSSASWNESPGNPSVVLSGSNPKTFTAVSAGNESITASYSGQSARTDVTVTCVPSVTCSSAPQGTNFCPDETYTVDNGCGTTLSCTGRRECDFNWKEVAP